MQKQIYHAPQPPRAPKAPRRPGKKGLCFALAVLVLLAAAGGLLVGAYNNWLELPKPLQARVDLLPEFGAKQSQDDTREPLASGAFRTVVNTLPTVEAGQKSCNIQFDNPAANPYDARLVLMMTETSEELGATHLLAPGKRVEELKLHTLPPPGEYPVTAVFQLYQGGKAAGGVTLALTLNVQS